MSERVRVAVLTNGYQPRLGGIERQLSLLLPRIAARGVDLAVFTRRDPGTAAMSVLDGIPVRRFSAGGGRAGAAASFVLGSLWRVQGFDPDVVHAHEFFSCTTAGVIRKRVWGTPLVVTPHGEDAARLDRKRFGRHRWSAMAAAADRFGLISADHDAELAARGVSPSQRIRVGAAVDDGHFAPASATDVRRHRSELDLEPSAPVAVFSGRVTAEKRIDLLLDAWPRVRRTHPAAQLLVVGDGEELDQLQRRRVRGCRFVGRVDDVLPYLQAADVYVHASAFEGFSSSILEAMSVALPVVAAPARGVAEAVGQSGCGIVLEGWDAEQLAASVASLFGDAERRRTLGARGRETATMRHGADSIADAWASLYREVAQEQTRRRRGSAVR